MISRLWLAAALAASFLPASAFAEDNGLFAGFDVSGGTASGSSDTTNGGAAIAGGGVVDNVKFGGTVGVGGHIGYRFRPALSAFISYQYVRGDVSWDADFPLFGVASSFSGKAISNAVMGNVAYEMTLSNTTSINASAGAGLSFNSLSGIVESDRPTGLFLSDVADHTHLSPVAQIEVGVQHDISPNIVLGLNVSVGYVGRFGTGNTRSGNLGVTSITPYEIDDVWRASLGAMIRFKF